MPLAANFNLLLSALAMLATLLRGQLLAAATSTPVLTAAIAPVVLSSSPIPAIPVPSVPTTTTAVATTTASSTNGWEGTWGTVATTTAPDTLTVQANASTTGGEAILEGIDEGGDYSFATKINWMRGETVTLLARYGDSKNYVACEFLQLSPGVVEIELEQEIKGTRYILATGVDNAFYNEDPTNIQAAITLRGSQGTCTFDDHVVSNTPPSAGTYSVNPPFDGMVGVTIWDPAFNNSEVILNDVTIDRFD